MNDLVSENELLKTEISRLMIEVASLKKKLDILHKHGSLAKGMLGESLVAGWVNGVITTHNASHDVHVGEGAIKLEIKYAGLNVARRNIQSVGRETLRWAWSKPFGESGLKVYDRLILVADKDPRYFAQYRDIDCPYLLFDIPFLEIMPLTIKTNNGRYRSIQLTTNPSTAKSAASHLFSSFQVTIEELKERYGL